MLSSELPKLIFAHFERSPVMNGNSTLNRHSLHEWFTKLRVKIMTKLVHFMARLLARC